MCPAAAQDPDKHREVNGLLGELADNRFADLVALGKHITDFTPDAGGAEGDAANGGAPGDALDDDIGVAVEFEGDEEDDEDEDVAELVVSLIRHVIRYFGPVHPGQSQRGCWARVRLCGGACQSQAVCHAELMLGWLSDW